MPPAPVARSRTRTIGIVVALVAAAALVVTALGGGLFWWLLQRAESPQAIAKRFWLAPCDGFLRYVYVDDGNRDGWSGSDADCVRTGYDSPRLTTMSDRLESWRVQDGSCPLAPPATAQDTGMLHTSATWNDASGALQRFDGYTCMVEMGSKWYVYSLGSPPGG
jgi:hypothetical protein